MYLVSLGLITSCTIYTFLSTQDINEGLQEIVDAYADFETKLEGINASAVFLDDEIKQAVSILQDLLEEFSGTETEVWPRV